MREAGNGKKRNWRSPYSREGTRDLPPPPNAHSNSNAKSKMNWGPRVKEKED